MNTPQYIKDYIDQVDYYIGRQGGLNKAQFLVETHEKIKNLQKSNPQMNKDYLVQTLGTPKRQAQVFLIQNGLETPREPFPFLKIFIIASLSIFLFFGVTTYYIYKEFTPLFKVNEEDGSIELFGGKIDLDKSDIDFDYVNRDSSLDYQKLTSQGSRNWIPPFKMVDVRQKNGTMTLKFIASEGFLKWDCRLEGNSDSPLSKVIPYKEAESVVVDLPQNQSSCVLEVPESAKVKYLGINSQLKVVEPRNSFEAQITNGRIEVDTQVRFNIKASVSNGLIQGAEGLHDPKAPSMTLTMTNGHIHFNP